MAQTPREVVDSEKRRIREGAEDELYSTDVRDRMLELADALDPDTVRRKYHDADGNVSTTKLGSIQTYGSALRMCASRDDLDLVDATAADINDAMDAFHDDDGKSKATLSNYQSAVKAFYRYHADLGVDPDDIVTFIPDSSPSVDETDMFEQDELDALRRACGETQLAMRNRAFLELLIFTGQRLKALLTLRVGDIKFENGNGYILLNTDYDEAYGGLKGAAGRGRNRPMFGAQKYVRDWLNIHPRSDDDDAWFFVADPSHPSTSLDEHWSENAARGLMKRLGKIADVEKSVQPRNFRHYCATTLYREYDVDTDAIRMLLGHAKDSKTLESTYRHLFDEDYIHKAEEALGYRDTDEDEGTSFVPDACPTCGKLLESDFRHCPICEERFAPTEEIEPVAEMLQEDITNTALSEELSPEERDGLRTLLDTVGDPETFAEKLDAVTE